VSYLGTVYFTTEATIKDKPELVQAFVTGLIKGWQKTYSDEQAAVDAISSFDPQSLTPELIRFNLEKQKRTIIPAGMRFCEYRREQWEALLQTLTVQRLLGDMPRLEDAVSWKFLQKHYAAN
jgi:ABC-type nitrate/sulfonate/bicarbonate transport system substrate-binding protein